MAYLIIDSADKVLATLEQLGGKIVALSDDITNLTTVVASLQADLGTVISTLTTLQGQVGNNLTADQVGALETAISTLQAMDTSAKNVITPPPAPTPTPTS